MKIDEVSKNELIKLLSEIGEKSYDLKSQLEKISQESDPQDFIDIGVKFAQFRKFLKMSPQKIKKLENQICIITE